MDQFFDEVDLYIRPNQNQHEEQNRKCSFSLEKSNDNLQTNKTKINSDANKNSLKGKYVQKLKNYCPKQEFASLNEQDEGCSLLSLSKKERNRISAKQSRDRKKLYIQLMEYEHKKLENELSEVNKQIQQTKQKINQFCSQNKTIYGFSTQSQLQGKLQLILANTQVNGLAQQINIILDSIILRMGATGKQRLQKQNQCYKQIVNLSLPPTHRYIMWATNQLKHLFSQNLSQYSQNEQFPCHLLTNYSAEISQQKQAKIRQVKNLIKNHKQCLLHLITKLWQSKQTLQQQIKKLDKSIDSLRDIFNPIQGAKILLFTNRNKFRNCMNFFKQDLQANQIQKISQPRKKVKKQELWN